MSLKSGRYSAVSAARRGASYFLISLFLFQHFFIVSPLISSAASASTPVVGPTASTSVVISEFRFRGTSGASDEFIELYNLTSAPIDIGGWKINGSNSGGTTGTRLIINAGTIIPAFGHFLATNSTATTGYSGSVPGNQTYTTGFTDDGGVALLNASNTIIDQVGLSAGSAYKEGTTLASLGSTNQNKCYERKPGGASGNSNDTDNNFNDFNQLSPCNPQNLASPITPPSGPTNPNATGTAATPSPVAAGNPTLLTVTVAPGTNPGSTMLTVKGDLTAIGGNAMQSFYDDGTNGDATIGDNIFSYLATVAAGTPPGSKTIPVTISDAEMRLGSAAITIDISHPPATPQLLPFSQNWSNTNLITVDNNWTQVPGIIGYLGSDPNTTAAGVDPQTILADLSNTPVAVVANQTDPAAALSGGVAEFEVPDPTIAIKGSGTADAANIVISLDTTGQSNVTVFYDLRDLDASSNNAVQPIALQYRVGNTGNYTNVPAAFVPDASVGDEAGQVTHVAASLPAAVENQPLVQLRIITYNAVGNDEWIGIDNINVTTNGTLPVSGSGIASPNQLNPGANTLLTVTVNPGSNPTSTGITVTGDLSSIGGSATQQFFDDGSNGDVTAGDNVFSFSAQIPANAPGGSRSLPVTIADAQSRSASISITLTIVAPVDTTEHILLGNPTNAVTDINQPFNYLLAKAQYAVSYHRDRRIPNWVSWHLDSTWIGSAQRQNDFRPDPEIPASWNPVTTEDYSGSGFDRGHHTPSADRTRSIPDNSATFLMTNIMPQAPGNNQGPWEDLESYSRTLLGSSELYIVMGGTGQGGTGRLQSGQTVFAETIAGGKVTVPAFTWKVILVLPIGENDVSRVNVNTRTIAVIMPNNHNIESHAWQQYIVSVDQVEALTGYNFFSEVPALIQNAIEAKIDGTNCSFSLNQPSANAPSAGNTGSVGVTAGQGCGWTATSNDDWITITGGATGSGSATVNYTIAPNTGAARSGTLVIGGQTFTINQAAAGRSIAGRIAYGTNNSKFVPDVNLTATNGNPDQTAVTTSTFTPQATAGSYLLQGLIDGGNYTVTPSKTTDINGINAFDATLVLRCVAAGVGCTLTPNQQIAADTDGRDGVTAFDAAQILRFVAAGGGNANTGQTGAWKFELPARTYNNLTTDQTGQDYTAFLMGDVDGDWAVPANLTEEDSASGEGMQKLLSPEVKLSFSGKAGKQTGNIEIIPIILTNHAGNPISSFNFHVAFNQKIRQPLGLAIETKGTLAERCAVAVNTTTAGKIGIAGACPDNLVAASGTLVNLRFIASSTQAKSARIISPLAFSQAPVVEDDNGNQLSIFKIN